MSIGFLRENENIENTKSKKKVFPKKDELIFAQDRYAPLDTNKTYNNNAT